MHSSLLSYEQFIKCSTKHQNVNKDMELTSYYSMLIKNNNTKLHTYLIWIIIFIKSLFRYVMIFVILFFLRLLERIVKKAENFERILSLDAPQKFHCNNSLLTIIFMSPNWSFNVLCAGRWCTKNLCLLIRFTFAQCFRYFMVIIGSTRSVNINIVLCLHFRVSTPIYRKFMEIK